MENKILYYLDEIERLKRGEFVPPISCEIDPSNICNANCPWCLFKKYRQASKAMLSWDTYLKLIYELKHLGTKSITFTGGGEPTVNPKFDQMVQVALDLGFEVGLITNGIRLDKVQNINKFKFIRVSLDASDTETYQKIKGVDEFHKVICNIRCALTKNPTVGISYVVGPDNCDDLQTMDELAELLGVTYVQYKPMFIDGKPFNSYKTSKSKDVINTRRYSSSSLNCIIAHLTGIVTADGGVYYCCQGRGKIQFLLGSLAHESFESLWRSRLTFAHNIQTRTCPPCRYGNYKKAYKEIVDEGDLFFQHRYFL